MYRAEILADSQFQGSRLTTMVVVFPRQVLAEFNTHRVFTRNSESSRAIPILDNIKKVLSNPYVPEAFGKDRRGMSSSEDLAGWGARLSRTVWLAASKFAAAMAYLLLRLDVHKEHANRLLEPFLWHEVIVSSTEWENFFAQRISKKAHPAIRRAATLMESALLASTPKQLKEGDWHIPLDVGVWSSDENHPNWNDFYLGNYALRAQGEPQAWRLMVAAGKLARVSYSNHLKVRPPFKDVGLAMRLIDDYHPSPFEHIAQAGDPATHQSNFGGPWTQLRHILFIGAAAPRDVES